MELIVDNDRFGEIQPWFVYRLIERIKLQLENAGLEGGQLKEISGDIASTVCNEIDGTDGFEVDGVEYTPYLSFSNNDEHTFYPGGSSFLHSYVSKALDEIFEPDA